MNGLRKHSSKCSLGIAAILAGVCGAYLFTGAKPVPAQYGDNPFARLQQQITALQVSQSAQNAFLVDLDERVTLLEEFVFGEGGGSGGGGGGGGGDIDFDGDGYSQAEGDCNDHEPTTHPGAVEIVGDLIDNDCDGVVDEED